MQGNKEADKHTKQATKGDATPLGNLPKCLKKALPISKAAKQHLFKKNDGNDKNMRDPSQVSQVKMSIIWIIVRKKPQIYCNFFRTDLIWKHCKYTKFLKLWMICRKGHGCFDTPSRVF